MTSTEGENILNSNSESSNNQGGGSDTKTNTSPSASENIIKKEKEAHSDVELTNTTQENSDKSNDVQNTPKEQSVENQSSSEKDQHTVGNEKEHSVVISINVPKHDISSESSTEHVTDISTNENEKAVPDKEANQNGKDDMDEYDPDLHITDEEREAFAFMIEKRKEELIKQKEKFQTWVDSITRRRMFALSRIRKINKSHAHRMEFYDKIDNYISSAETVISSSAQNSVLSSESNTPQKFEDIVRENTGFTLNTSTPIGESLKTGYINGANTSSPIGQSKNSQVHVDINTPNQKHDNSAQNESNGIRNVEGNSKRSDNSSSNNENTPKIIPVNS